MNDDDKTREDLIKERDEIFQIASDLENVASRMSYTLITGGGNDRRKLSDDYGVAGRAFNDFRRKRDGILPW
jgi:hypothetical protein